MKSNKEKLEDIRETLHYIDKTMSKMRDTIDKLEKENNMLKQDKVRLMKIIMKSPESKAFPEMAHHIYFALIEVLKDNSLSDEEKLENLKIYLKPSLDKDTHQALYFIEDFKQDHKQHEALLNDLSSWIKYTYKLN